MHPCSGLNRRHATAKESKKEIVRKNLISLIASLSLCAALALPLNVQAQRPPRHFKHIPSVQRSPAPSQIPLLQRAQTLRLSAWNTRNIILAVCPPDAVALDPSVSCGYVALPLERKNSKEEKINIYFEVYPHTNAGLAESVIVPNPGGPGQTTSGLRGLWFNVFAPNLDAHDLLLMDDRGRGLSGALGVAECQDLQHGIAPSFDQAVAQCAAQLGDDNSRYGTGDIALDVEAVRAALGYDKLDFYGGSYGGVDAVAYATRFGGHLRSLVLDSPDGPPALLPFSFVHYEAPATSREVRLDCLRSPACSIDHPRPDAEWKELIRTIRSHPVDGMAYDASGNLIPVHFDESVLLVLAEIPAGGYINTGEFLGAADALEHGDPAPLLRLGAEGYVPLLIDYGDPTSFSWVALNATGNVDAQLPFDFSVPPQLRLEQFEKAVSDLPPDYFHPFSVAAATSLENGQAVERAAIFWEEATPPAPVVPPGARYPNVPTLAMGSDIEPVVPLELATKVAALFPESTFVSIAGGVHESAIGGNQCALGLAVHFIETLQVGDTSCAEMPETIWPAVGRFPLLAEDARAAEVDPNGMNEIGEAERKVVTVALAAATDALQRSILGSGDSVGLRAGTFHTDFGSIAWTTTLTNCVFAKDVTVSGTVVWVPAGSFQADLSVSGAGTAGGNLHVDGTFVAPGPVGKFKVSGTLGGKQVAVLVPEG
jgi:pimeloyl-ACP methyl ester carboxylesterase